MDACALPLTVSALACAIAREIPDANALALLSAVLTQLGDTLATLAAQQALCEGLSPPREPP